MFEMIHICTQHLPFHPGHTYIHIYIYIYLYILDVACCMVVCMYTRTLAAKNANNVDSVIKNVKTRL